MKHIWLCSLAVVGIGILAPRAEAQCTCAVAKKDNGWCKDCKVGYFEAVKVKSKKVFDVLEGHKIDPTKKTTCAACRKALKNEGFCADCGVGFVDGQAYHSWVAYRLARGEVKDPTEIKCAACQKAAKDSGWCEQCGVGYVAHRKFAEKDNFKQALEARKALMRAASSKCEQCAVAIVSDGTCKACGIRYERGHKHKTDEKIQL